MCVKEIVLCLCCVSACACVRVCVCVCPDCNEKADVQTTFTNPQEMRLPRTSLKHHNMPHATQGIWRQCEKKLRLSKIITVLQYLLHWRTDYYNRYISLVTEF